MAITFKKSLHIKTRHLRRKSVITNILVYLVMTENLKFRDFYNTYELLERTFSINSLELTRVLAFS